jgi:hypothetical protein
MRSINKELAALALCGLLAACASTVTLTGEAKSLRDRMTAPQAESLLNTFAHPDATHGGLCLVGVRVVITRLDYDKPVTVSGSVISFGARYAVLGGGSVNGNVAAGTGRVTVNYGAEHAILSVDTRTLTEIRVLETNPNLLGLCRHYKPGYVVAVKTQQGLPDQSQISLNADSRAELDTLLATLTFLSPRARLVGGIGM